MIKVGTRFKIEDLRVVAWNKGQAKSNMESDGIERAADIRDGERIIGIFNPVNSFDQLILVAKLKEE